MNKLNNDINVIFCIDHSGRSGNSFLLTLFDQHPQVLSCLWVQYIYSYIITYLGDHVSLRTSEAHDIITKKSMFKYIYNELNSGMKQSLIRIGSDPDIQIDRGEVRRVFDIYFKKESITRRNIILAIYQSLAAGINRDVTKIKYLLLSDAISLRTETVLEGFSGKIVNAVISDFPAVQFIHLVRDPRAVFASTRHQYVNKYNNMYDLKPGLFIDRLIKIIHMDLSMDYGCVYLFWLCCMAKTAQTIYKLKNRKSKLFTTIRNEDLNICFKPTMMALADKLRIDIFDDWFKEQYVPTALGRPWRGTGGYNERYQSDKNKRLKNDAQDISDKLTGPNEYVTKRWRTQLQRNEIHLVEMLFKSEITRMKYSFVSNINNIASKFHFIINLMYPLKGELPSITWLIKGGIVGRQEMWNRLYYCLMFIPLYIMSRVTLARLYFSGYFNNEALDIN